MRCSVAPAARQVRPAFPVFQWISGCTSTTWVDNDALSSVSASLTRRAGPREQRIPLAGASRALRLRLQRPREQGLPYGIHRLDRGRGHGSAVATVREAMPIAMEVLLVARLRLFGRQGLRVPRRDDAERLGVPLRGGKRTVLVAQ